jgi:hypothetical protein
MRLPQAVTAALLVVLALLIFAPSAPAGGTAAGTLLWQDQVDLAGGHDLIRAVAAGHGRVAAVGSAQNADGDDDFVVRVYHARTGKLSWKDRVDVASANDAATAVVLDDERIFVAGTSTDAAGDSQLLLRAYAAKSGRLAWEDRAALVAVNGLALHGSRLVVAGTTMDADGNSGPLVRAYVARTGALAWEDRSLPAGFGQFLGGRSAGVAIHGRTAFVTGSIRRPPGDPDFSPRCLVRAHDLRTGSIVWQSIHDSICSAWAVASDGKRVIVAAQGGAVVDDFLVQSYEADTGQFLWEDRTFVSTAFDNAAVAVDIERRLAFVAGWVRWVPGRQNQEAFLVRAYDTGTGVLRWEDQFPSASLCICQARDVVVDRGRVIAVGAGPGTWLVRAYEARHGDLLWSDEFAPVGGIGPNPFDAEGALAVAIDGGRVFVGGSGVNASGDADLILRTYDAK